MGILKENTKITWAWLKDQGFWRDGWGSPYYRETHNTKMYETVRQNEEGDLSYWQIMYFPKSFEGIFCKDGMQIDVSGRVVMTETEWDKHDHHFISPVVKTPQDIEMFIRAVFTESWEQFSAYEYFKSRYYGGLL